MKAIVTIELQGDCPAIGHLSAEAPSLEMLKTSVARTVLVQMSDLIKHVFETAAKPKPKEIESEQIIIKKPEPKTGTRPGSKAKSKARPNAQANGGNAAVPADAAGPQA